jgi:hypothetical protein
MSAARACEGIQAHIAALRAALAALPDDTGEEAGGYDPQRFALSQKRQRLARTIDNLERLLPLKVAQHNTGD